MQSGMEGELGTTAFVRIVSALLECSYHSIPGKRPYNCFCCLNGKRPLLGKCPGNMNQDNAASIHQYFIQEYNAKILSYQSLTLCIEALSCFFLQVDGSEDSLIREEIP